MLTFSAKSVTFDTSNEKNLMKSTKMYFNVPDSTKWENIETYLFDKIQLYENFIFNLKTIISETENNKQYQIYLAWS